MSLWYTFEMRTTLDPQQAACVIARHLDLRCDGTTLTVPNAVFMSAAHARQTARTQTEQDFGFRTTLHINFDVYAKGGYHEGHDSLAKAVAALLREDVGDAVLLYNGERVLLRRTNEEITLNEGWGDELAPALDAAGLRHRARSLMLTGTGRSRADGSLNRNTLPISDGAETTVVSAFCMRVEGSAMWIQLQIELRRCNIAFGREVVSRKSYL